MSQFLKKPLTALLIIDPQNDFHDGGSLAVPGAVEDSNRIAKMIEKKGAEIDQIYVTLDSHHRMHIAHASFWRNSFGEEPSPFTIITHEDVRSKKWTPVDSAHYNHCLYYTEQLDKLAKNKLCIWPEHCLIGTRGHAVVGILNSALQQWCMQNKKCVTYVHKGQNCLTEMYSALKADVVLKDDPNTALNTPLIDELKSYDLLFICGEAKSHCVNFTVRDLISQYTSPEKEKVVLLADGCSPVPSFEQSGDSFFQEMHTQGCLIGLTTDFDDCLQNAMGATRGSRSEDITTTLKNLETNLREMTIKYRTEVAQHARLKAQMKAVSEWVCCVCTLRNAETDMQCSACGAQKISYAVTQREEKKDDFQHQLDTLAQRVDQQNVQDRLKYEEMQKAVADMKTECETLRNRQQSHSEADANLAQLAQQLESAGIGIEDILRIDRTRNPDVSLYQSMVDQLPETPRRDDDVSKLCDEMKLDRDTVEAALERNNGDQNAAMNELFDNPPENTDRTLENSTFEC